LINNLCCLNFYCVWFSVFLALPANSACISIPNGEPIISNRAPSRCDSNGVCHVDPITKFSTAQGMGPNSSSPTVAVWCESIEEAFAAEGFPATCGLYYPGWTYAGYAQIDGSSFYRATCVPPTQETQILLGFTGKYKICPVGYFTGIGITSSGGQDVTDCLCGSGTGYSCPTTQSPIQICQANVSSGGIAGNPILPATAEKLLTKTDFSDSAPHSLDFTRFYRTQWGDIAPSAGMGTHWGHRFAVQLTGTGNSRTVQHADGSQSRFTRSSSTATWVNTDGTDTLVETTLNNVVSMLYTSAQDDSRRFFNSAGKLVSQTARNGWTYTLAYDATGQLASVTNQFSRVLSFSYDAAGMLSTVSTPTGSK
jgi:YD repeat-containing protein